MLQFIKTFFFIVLFFSSLQATAQPKIKIGVSLPLTGSAANEGADLKNIMNFANKYLANGRYDLIFEDDKCSNKDAVAVAQKLSSIDKVEYVMGYACSGAILSAAPILERSHIVTLGLGTGAPEIAKAGDYIFRTIPSLDVAARKLFEHADKRFKKVAIISEQTAYCMGLSDAFERENKEKHLTIERVDFVPDTIDFRSILLKLKAHGNEAIFLNTQDEKGLINMYKQFLQANWPVQVYGAYYPGFSEFMKTFGASANGIVFADLPFIENGLNSQGKELYQKYVSEYGKPQSTEFYFVITLAAFSALEQAVLSGTNVRDYLYSNSFESVFGPFKFDSNGDIQGANLGFTLKTIEQGKVVSN